MKNENKIFELMRINSPYIFSKKLNSTTQKNKL